MSVRPHLALLILAGVLSGCFRTDEQSPQSPVGTSVSTAVSYADPQEQQRFKAALASAGISVTTELLDGKEFVHWATADAEAVAKVQASLFGSPLPEGRHVSFGSPAVQQEFTTWLAQNEIPFKTVASRGREYVVWQARYAERVQQWPKSYLLPTPPKGAT